MCFLCKIIGHKWVVSSFDEKMIGKIKRRDTKHTVLDHCLRCGEKAPTFTKIGICVVEEESDERSRKEKEDGA